MIRHIALFRFKPGYSWRDTQVLEAEILAQQVGDNVPDLLDWSAGRNMSERAAAYDYAIIGLLDDDSALQRYMAHPFHQVAIEKWRAISDWVIADVQVE